MIYFTLPNFYTFSKLNNFLINLYNDHPDYFHYKKIVFTGEEGNFPYCYWSGGNNLNFAFESVLSRADIREFSNSLTRVLDCSNINIIATDLFDVKMNAILEEFENGSNKIIVTSPLLIEFLKNTYKQFYLIGSNFYPLFDPDKKYIDDLYLIRQKYRDFNNQYFTNIPKSKIEICVHSGCCSCPETTKQQCLNTHHKELSLFMEKSTLANCPNQMHNALKPEEIIELNKKGYTHFYFDTISNHPLDYSYLIDLYLHIFIKDEYKTEVMLQMLREVPNNGN